MALVLSISACEKDKIDSTESTQQILDKPTLVLEDLSPDLKQRLLFGPEGSEIGNLNAVELEARNDDPRIDSLVELYVSHYSTEESLNYDLQERGFPSWNYTLLPGEGFGENVFVIPVIKECELKGNYFVFHDNETSLLDHRMDYYSYDYTDMGYLYGGYFMSDEEMSALYMVAGGQATSQYVLLGTVDTATVLFRHYVSEAGGIGGELAGRTTSCSILYCEGLETSLPPVIADNGDPNAGGGGGCGGSWPPQVGPGAPGWHNGSYGSTAQGWGGGGSGVNINWRPITRFFGGVVGGVGGMLDGIGDWFKRRKVLCYQFRVQPDIKDRLDEVSKQVSNLEQRSGNCRWKQVHSVEDVSMYTYLGNTQLGDDWGDGINGFECRGIAFENEAMGIDFAWSIQNILASYDVDWEMIDCLASNSEYAAAVNFALDHYKDATTCDGTSIEDYLAADMEAFCPGTGNPSAGDELMRRLEGEEWIDYSGLEENCPCLAGVMDGMLLRGTEWLCNSLAAFEGAEGRVTTITTIIPNGKGVPSDFYDRQSERYTTAITIIDDLNLNSTIVINPSLCDASFIDPPQSNRNTNSVISIIRMIVHEGYHAKFRHEVSQLINLPATTDDVRNFRALFRSIYVDEVGGWECGGSYASEEEHEFLVRKYIFEIAFALWEFNNFQGEQLDYVFAAGGGLLGDTYHWSECALNFFTQAELDNFKTRNDNLQSNYPLLFNEPCSQ